MLNKYSQNYDFYIFYFVSLEVGTAALKIFCVMIPYITSSQCIKKNNPQENVAIDLPVSLLTNVSKVFEKLVKGFTFL